MKSNFFYPLALLIFLGFSACSSRTALAQRDTHIRVVYVKKIPPQPKFEVYKRCNRYHIWIKGHWQWNGHFYIWKKGHCVKKRNGFIWVQGALETYATWLEMDTGTLALKTDHFQYKSGRSHCDILRLLQNLFYKNLQSGKNFMSSHLLCF